MWGGAPPPYRLRHEQLRCHPHPARHPRDAGRPAVAYRTVGRRNAETLVRQVPWHRSSPGRGRAAVQRALATDAGAGFLATGLALAVVALWGHRVAIQTALLAYATFAAPHLLYHAANPSVELTSSEDFLNVALLATGPALAALLAWRVGRARPVAPATREQQGKEDEVTNDEAQVAGRVGSAR